jgi:hypothetical protein
VVFGLFLLSFGTKYFKNKKMSVTSSQAQNISSPNGNSLAVFVDGITGVLTLKDINGKIEPISNYITLTPSNVNGGLFAQTSSSTPVNATTVETSLLGNGVGNLSVPANGFTVGDSFNADSSGIISAQNNVTITIRIKSGNVVLSDSGALTLPNINTQVWNLQMDFTIRTIGTSGVASIATKGLFNVLRKTSGQEIGFGFNSINNTTFDTTISNTLSITVQWSSNNVTNNIYSEIFILNKIF